MALTLIEQAKRGLGNEQQEAVVAMFADMTPILRYLPFRTISGNSYTFSREHALPGVAFRGVNESYTNTTGVINPITEALTIFGGEIEVDEFILRTEGLDARDAHEDMMLKALSETWQSKFFKGDASSNPREFDGLQNRLTGNQVVDAGDTSGGDALSLNKLDELIDAVTAPTHLCMNKAMRRRLTQAARVDAVGGHIDFSLDEFGRRVTTFNDIPILVIEDALGEDTVLPFTEANPGGGTAASTSIYCLSLGSGMVEGLHNSPPSVRDLGEQDSTPQAKTRIEWYSTFTVMNGRAAARLRGVKNAAVVA